MRFISRRKTNLVIFIVLIVNIISIIHVKYWDKSNKIIAWDVISYYSYLPAAFIEKDLSLDFVDKDIKKYGDHYWPFKTKDNRNVIKTTMGMAVVYSPFFLLGHAYANAFGYETDGFSNPYRFSLILASVIFLLIGLIYARKVLLLFFDEKTVAYTLVFIGLGTNLYYYSAFANAMPHLYNFTLFTMFVFYSLKWHKTQTFRYAVYIGLLLGLITLIRPVNGLIIVFFLFYGVCSFTSLTKRLNLLLSKYPQVLLMGLITFLVILPQLFYWKFATGHWIYYSYQDEKFFFDNPQIINGLFSFRKGWFIYTPLMFIAFVSIPFLYKKHKELLWPVVIFTVLNIYIVFSWWCWWYGGSFGQRPMIDSYIIMTFPLALFISFLLKSGKWIRIAGFVVLFWFLFLNLFQSQQYRYRAIHWDAMTKEAYCANFLQMFHVEGFEDMLSHPDVKAAMKGENRDLTKEEAKASGVYYVFSKPPK